MKKKKDVNKLVEMIDYELENECDSRVYPQICNRIKDKRVKTQIIKSAVNLVAKEGQSITGAIAQIESELDHS